MVTLLKKLFVSLMALSFVIIAYPAYAVDAPHTEASDPGFCTNCHTSHQSVGGNFTKVKGNVNVCLQCHIGGGLAQRKGFDDFHRAMPGTSGISHRWDSGPGGYVTRPVSNTSTGSILSGVVGGQSGVFNGTSARIYEITITTEGNVGTAYFQWRSSDDGGTTWTAPNGTFQAITDNGTTYNSLSDNIKISFSNGSTPSTTCNMSFCANDTWTVTVRPQINFPTNNELARRMFRDDGAYLDIADVTSGDTYTIKGSTYGKASCSTCHNQHYQTNKSFDPLSPSSGDERHFQRINNEQNQMCLDCHSARNINDVETWQGVNVKLSHPVGVWMGSGYTGTGANSPEMHSVPKEPYNKSDINEPNYLVDTPQSAYATSGKATSSGTTLCMTDTTKNFDSNYVNLWIYFLPRPNITGEPPAANPYIMKKIESVSGGNTVCWNSALAYNVGSNDPYVIDADGNPTNNLRFFDDSDLDLNNWKPSFTKGKVYCLTCHGPHWTDSDETTYDRLP